MNVWLILAFLFFMGSVIGWALELVFRRFFSSANPQHKWINPGFCTGPYVPLYGFGLCILYLIASLEQLHWIAHPFWNQVVLFVAMAVGMTVIEYIAGIICLKVMKVRLWDYRKEWGNVQGIICPKFSLAWALLGAVYYWLIHPYILDALTWLSCNLAFSFFIGLFFGVFLIDAVHSAQLVSKLKQYAEENQVIVRYEALKSHIRRLHDESRQKYHFFRPFRWNQPLSETLREMRDSLEKRKGKKV